MRIWIMTHESARFPFVSKVCEILNAVNKGMASTCMCPSVTLPYWTTLRKFSAVTLGACGPFMKYIISVMRTTGTLCIITSPLIGSMNATSIRLVRSVVKSSIACECTSVQAESRRPARMRRARRNSSCRERWDTLGRKYDGAHFEYSDTFNLAIKSPLPSSRQWILIHRLHDKL